MAQNVWEAMDEVLNKIHACIMEHKVERFEKNLVSIPIGILYKHFQTNFFQEQVCTLPVDHGPPLNILHHAALCNDFSK